MVSHPDFKINFLGWEDDSVSKSICYVSMRPGFKSPEFIKGLGDQRQRSIGVFWLIPQVQIQLETLSHSYEVQSDKTGHKTFSTHFSHTCTHTSIHFHHRCTYTYPHNTQDFPKNNVDTLLLLLDSGSLSVHTNIPV